MLVCVSIVLLRFILCVAVLCKATMSWYWFAAVFELGLTLCVSYYKKTIKVDRCILEKWVEAIGGEYCAKMMFVFCLLACLFVHWTIVDQQRLVTVH